MDYLLAEVSGEEYSRGIVEFVKKNIIVILAFLLPLLLILGLTASVYLPSLFLSTKYDFIYATCDRGSDYYYSDSNCGAYLNGLYTVQNGKLIKQYVVLTDANKNYSPRIFLHDTQANAGREISLEDAQRLTLDSLITSPDGVTVGSYYERGQDFFPFFGSSSQYGHYLMKGRSRSRLNLVNENESYYYRDNFKFLGWVKTGQ